MTDLIKSAADLQVKIDRMGIPNCIIGGLALQAWGEVRVTRDADFTILTGFVDEQAKAESVLALVTPRRPDALEFGLVNRVLLGYMEGNVPVDIGLGGFDFERRMVDRSRSIEMAEGLRLRVCGPEDLIVTKVFAGRPRDWEDVASVITRQGEGLDRPLVEEELTPLLDLIEEPERLQRLRSLG